MEWRTLNSPRKWIGLCTFVQRSSHFSEVVVPFSQHRASLTVDCVLEGVCACPVGVCVCVCVCVYSAMCALVQAWGCHLHQLFISLIFWDMLPHWIWS
jgi:hypothetical protein